MEKPLVSIVCITYNHEPFLRQTLDSFLMQETTFPVEIILAEDCSTDDTRNVIADFIAQHADCELEKNHYRLKNGMSLHYIWSENNVGAKMNELRAMQAARGKYIAFCEGDDYWTEPWKLQRQVDWMEKHPEYVVTWHRFHHYVVDTKEWRNDRCESVLKEKNGANIDCTIMQSVWCTQPLAMIFRRDCLDLNLYCVYEYYRDTHQIYHLLKHGKGFLFGWYAGVRVMHEGGICSMISQKERFKIALAVSRELYEYNRDAITKKNLIDTLHWIRGSVKDKKEYLRYSWEIFKLDKNIYSFVRSL